MKRGLRLPSGRVIAIGRYMLATLFVAAMWFDFSQPSGAPPAVFALLGSYAAFALLLVVLTWNNWWLDAKLAGPSHAIDILVFTLLFVSTEGYTSPDFTFFMFLLLSAAIRWGWRATTLTAVLLTLLYLLAGIVVTGQTVAIDLQRFMIRTGHLVILSLILIWFGINQWRSGVYARDTRTFGEPSIDESPLETSLRAAMHGVGAGTGTLVWREQGGDHADAYITRNGELAVNRMNGDPLIDSGAGPFLYDLPKDRALARDAHRNLRAFKARQLIPAQTAASLQLSEGIAIPIRTGAGEGELFLERLPNLSTDHIELGNEVALDVVSHIERHALMLAVEDSAEARSRLALARDLHDSVVQFLAGAAFRIEALKRDQEAGRDLAPELNHLKRLMLEEQGELRSFIAALRSAPKIGLDELAGDLKALSARLAQQWDVFCDFSAQTTDMVVPTRLQLDAQHLIREAVANAVRHAGAKTVTIRLRAEGDELMLDFINDGARYPKSPLTGDLPRSLSERVKLAGGALELTRGMGITKISVALPISGRIH
jgi:signal transduction histidine kinase